MRAGMCGTDLHIWLGEYDSVPPVTMGHEVCGTVAEAGDGVDRGWLGARVAVETFFSTCGVCEHCRAGKLSVCEQRRSIGTHVDGGFAPRLVLPARNLHRVPDGCRTRRPRCRSRSPCVQLAARPQRGPARRRRAGDRPGRDRPDRRAGRARRRRRVTVRGTERDGPRLALAGELGFETSAAGATPEADVVVECSGAGPGIADALRAARRRGRIVQMGLRGADVTIPYDLICFHELTVTAGFASNPALVGAGDGAAGGRSGGARAAGHRGRAAARLAARVRGLARRRGRQVRARPAMRTDDAAGVIFDCDGTLVDSEPLARHAWERALAPYGYALTDADAEASVGLPYPRVHAYYAERVELPGRATRCGPRSRASCSR